NARSVFPAGRAVARIAHGPQRIISEEIGICIVALGRRTPPGFCGRGSRGPGEAIRGPARGGALPSPGDKSERGEAAADIECRFSDCRDAASVSLLTNFSAQRRHLSAIRSQVALL